MVTVPDKIFGVDRSTLAGGLAGVISWGLMLAATAAGVIIPVTAITPIALLIASMVVHFVPDAAKIDEEIKEVAKLTPVIDPTYPGDDKKYPTVTTNTNKDKDNG